MIKDVVIIRTKDDEEKIISKISRVYKKKFRDIEDALDHLIKNHDHDEVVYINYGGYEIVHKNIDNDLESLETFHGYNDGGPSIILERVSIRPEYLFILYNGNEYTDKELLKWLYKY